MRIILPSKEYGIFKDQNYMYLTVSPSANADFGLQAVVAKKVTKDDIDLLFSELKTNHAKVRLLSFSNVEFTNEAMIMLAVCLAKNNNLFMLRFENIINGLDLIAISCSLGINKNIQILQLHNINVTEQDNIKLSTINESRSILKAKTLHVEITDEQDFLITEPQQLSTHGINYAASKEMIAIACAMVKWKDQRYLNAITANRALIFNKARYAKCAAISTTLMFSSVIAAQVISYSSQAQVRLSYF